jgi:predicted choloylglycine hydrolase
MTQQKKEVNFHYYVLEGSAYDVGRQQGEVINRIAPLKQWFCSGAKTFSKSEVSDIQKQSDKFCPGLLEEIRGCADTLGVCAEEIVYLVETYQRVNHCSHFAVLPSITVDRHVLVGRSYEFNDVMDDLTFMTTRIKGKYAHLGSSGLWFGRNDGMNEHGLVVTMSTGGVPVGRLPGMTPPIQTGFMFWALVRTLLDQCRNVDEALTVIERFPCASNPILLINDSKGTAAMVEIWGHKHEIKVIDSTSKEQFLCAANHFTLPKMVPYAPYMMNNSKIRYETICSRLKETAPQVTSKQIRRILSDPYPDGLCANYYEEGFGTLHAIIFDTTDITAKVCFGTPQLNPWHQFDLRHPGASGIYPATLLMEHADKNFWGRIALA